MSTTAVVPSIRDRLKVIQTQVVTSALSPAEVRDNLLLLVGLFGSVVDESREADHAHNLLVASYIDAGDSVAKAEARSKVSSQYKRAREAHDVERVLIEMIRSSKKFLESLDVEMRLAR